MEDKQASQASQPIKCEASGKLLARKTHQGLYLWCKVHKAWEYHTWAELIGEVKPAAK
jgi:hypothetical protein